MEQTAVSSQSQAFIDPGQVKAEVFEVFNGVLANLGLFPKNFVSCLP
jgi:hypothetical protein